MYAIPLYRISCRKRGTAARKKAEQVGKADPDRDEQFRFIDRLSAEILASGDPVISVDTKIPSKRGAAPYT